MTKHAADFLPPPDPPVNTQVPTTPREESLFVLALCLGTAFIYYSPDPFSTIAFPRVKLKLLSVFLALHVRVIMMDIK